MTDYLFNDALVPTAVQPLLRELFSRKNFANFHRLIGSSTGRGTAWFLDLQTELGLNVVLRHYRRGGLFGKIVKDRYLFRSLPQTRAVQEFHLLKQMREWGLPVPRPIAVQVKRGWLCYQADIMLEKIENTADLSQFLQKNRLTDGQYQQLGKLIHQLHQHQVHHSDLNIHNILLDQNGQFWLIDFDKCGVAQGESWKIANLDRLLRSFKKEQIRLGIQFNDENWASVLKGYSEKG